MTLRAWLLDALFPPSCVSCHRIWSAWCAACREDVELIPHAICPNCLSTSQGHHCRQTDPWLDEVWACGYYHEPRLRAVIHGLKYHQVTSALPDVRAFIERWVGVAEFASHLTPAVVIQPIPTDPRRVIERGFDQAQLVAEMLSKILDRPLVSYLERKPRSLFRQAELTSADERVANLRESFRLKSAPSSEEIVLLVDDVITSGATVREAAQTLKSAGVKQVIAWSLAIGA